VFYLFGAVTIWLASGIVSNSGYDYVKTPIVTGLGYVLIRTC
jgi:hypothetical protein